MECSFIWKACLNKAAVLPLLLWSIVTMFVLTSFLFFFFKAPSCTSCILWKWVLHQCTEWTVGALTSRWGCRVSKCEQWLFAPHLSLHRESCCFMLCSLWRELSLAAHRARPDSQNCYCCQKAVEKLQHFCSYIVITDYCAFFDLTVWTLILEYYSSPHSLYQCGSSFINMHYYNKLNLFVICLDGQ